MQREELIRAIRTAPPAALVPALVFSRSIPASLFAAGYFAVIIFFLYLALLFSGKRLSRGETIFLCASVSGFISTLCFILSAGGITETESAVLGVSALYFASVMTAGFRVTGPAEKFFSGTAAVSLIIMAVSLPVTVIPYPSAASSFFSAALIFAAVSALSGKGGS